MIIQVRSEVEDYRERYELIINGEVVFAVFDGEPEDNTIGRNFNDVYKLEDIIKKVHEAGVRQEPLTFKED